MPVGRAVLFSLFVTLSWGGVPFATAQPFSLSWSKANWSPCEGFGVHGSFRVLVEGSTMVGPSVSLQGLSVRAWSASFDHGSPVLTAVATVKNAAGQTVTTVPLARPDPNSDFVEPAAAPNETRRLYAPSGSSIDLPNSGTITFDVSVSVQTTQGACSLGRTSKTFTRAELLATE
jgi:hypothetical protein